MKKCLMLLGIGICFAALFLALSLFLSVRSQSGHQPVSSPSPTTSVVLMPIEVDPKVPKQIYPCLVPKADQNSLKVRGEEVKKIELLGQATDAQNKTFFYLKVDTVSDPSIGGAPNFFQPLVRLDVEGKCTSLHPEDEYGPVSYYASMAIARELALQWLKKQIEHAGSKAKYQQQLIDESQHFGTAILLAPEDVWAYEHLGIRLPAGYVILRKPISRSQASDIIVPELSHPRNSQSVTE